MDKRYLLTMAVAAMVFTMTSCSSEYPLTDESSEKLMISIPPDDVQINNVGIQNSSIRNQFSTCLLMDKALTTNDCKWDLDQIVEFRNESESIYCYMTIDKHDSNKIMGGCTTKEGLIATFFTFERKGKLFTLKDEQGFPVIDVELNNDNNMLTLVNDYSSTAQTRANFSEWCGIGMGAIGFGYTVLAAPMTLGASVGFFACWSVVSAVMCRV